MIKHTSDIGKRWRSLLTQFHAKQAAANQKGEGRPAAEAQTAPECQQSSHFIIYLRACAGGRAGGRDGENRGRGRSEGLWERTVTSRCCRRSWSFIHHTPLAWLRVWLLVWQRVHSAGCGFISSSSSSFFFYANANIPDWDTKLQQDVTPVRRLHSSLRVREGDEKRVCVCGRVVEEEEVGGRAGPRRWRRARLAAAAAEQLWIVLYARNLISWMCHKSLGGAR